MRKNIWTMMCGVIVAVVGSGTSTSGQAERSRRMPAEIATIPIEASMTAGGQKYESSAPGKCTHAPTASIYGVVSELWTAQQSDNGKSLNLSLWQPKDGSRPMVSLTIASGNSSHRVSTIKGTQIVGNAKVSMEQSGRGGTFTVYAKSAEGADIIGTIKCEAFAPHVAEGGL
jgi:hypothetical protein